MKVGGLGARRAESLKQCWIFGNGRGRSTVLAHQVRFDRSIASSFRKPNESAAGMRFASLSMCSISITWSLERRECRAADSMH